MPASSQEIGALVLALCRMEIMPDSVIDIVWADGDKITQDEAREAFIRAYYEIRLRNRYDRKAQRRALRLLRRFLDAGQKRQMRTCGYFHVAASSGTVYRLFPYLGMARRVELHRTRYFETHRYCIHDIPEIEYLDAPEPAARPMPPADVFLAHLFLLTADEAEFLATANETRLESSLWDSGWLRRRAQIRKEEARQKALAEQEAV